MNVNLFLLVYNRSVESASNKQNIYSFSMHSNPKERYIISHFFSFSDFNKDAS